MLYSMHITITKATLADAGYISQLGKQTFRESFGHLFSITEELNDYLEQTFSLTKIRSSLQKENNIFWIAWYDSQPVGYAKLKRYSCYENISWSNASQLQKIYVVKDFLDKKIGEKLYQALYQTFQTLDSQSLWLVVLENNQRAIRFYEKNGFQKVKKHLFRIGSQDFLFELMEKVNLEETPLEKDQTLDPQNWQEIRSLGHQMLDDMMDYLEHISQTPVWRQIPAEVKSVFDETLPMEPTDAQAVYESFKTNILPYNKGNIHPRFFAWVQGTGTPMGMLSEMLAATMNPNVTIGEHASMYVDRQVVNWCKQMMNFPENATGILLSGASMANITALNVARNTQLAKPVRTKGIGVVAKPMRIYCSVETHSCIQKAAEACGLGTEAVRKIEVNDNYQIDTEALEIAIEQDLAQGFAPFCIVGNAGTVNTAAIDPIDKLLEISKKYNLWLHIDGAFGALAKLVPRFAPQLKALEEADSIAFDLHKWLYMPYEIGCVLIRNAAAHRDSFSVTPSYLLQEVRGLAGGLDPINNYGLELSRGFKALKVWMSLKEHGMRKYAEMIEKNIQQAFYLGHLIEQTQDLELLTPVTMNIVCFRFKKSEISEQQLNELNKELLIQLQEQGIASPSSTVLKNRYAIRVCIVNQRTRKADLELLVQETQRIGQGLWEAFDRHKS
jgi:aromatic-L-amino-acid/L-tryptophan decarboxylase